MDLRSSLIRVLGGRGAGARPGIQQGGWGQSFPKLSGTSTRDRITRTGAAVGPVRAARRGPRALGLDGVKVRRAETRVGVSRTELPPEGPQRSPVQGRGARQAPLGALVVGEVMHGHGDLGVVAPIEAL